MMKEREMLNFQARHRGASCSFEGMENEELIDLDQ